MGSTLVSKNKYNYERIQCTNRDKLIGEIKELSLSIDSNTQYAIHFMLELGRDCYKARELFKDYSVLEEFEVWVKHEKGITGDTATKYIRAVRFYDAHFSGCEKQFHIGAMNSLGSKKNQLPGVVEEVRECLARGEIITIDVAQHCVKRAKRDIVWPDAVCDEVRALMLKRDLPIDMEEMALLGEYDPDIQTWLVESVVERKQTMSQAVAVGEVPESTVADTIKEENKKIDALCRALIETFNKLAPTKSPLVDSRTLESAKKSIDSCRDTLQGVKGYLCPVCEGVQDDCDACYGLGRVSQLRWSQLR